jgi:hypothetical protein
MLHIEFMKFCQNHWSLLEIEGVKTTENKIHGSVGMYTGHGQFFAFRVITVKKRVYEKINIFIEAT